MQLPVFFQRPRQEHQCLACCYNKPNFDTNAYAQLVFITTSQTGTPMLSRILSSKPHGDTNALACCHPAIRTRTSMLHLALIQQATLGHHCLACCHPASRTGTPLFRLLSPSSQTATPLLSLQYCHAASHTGTPMLSLISSSKPD